ncbi:MULTISPECIES: DUF2231 domain-containing protein [unclassified Pseudonocardia]|jgi:formate hydrogenlyase subunit 3/multisubunit Na+/H+ antiporter MnhD subunit|uniref:DUF2231 domain-containing protein n=1 Tax=unclassified Pseudonocardia TaxID=2619320 RepID=UPI00095D9B3F|nr:MULTISPECIES: DUF2231 domain-containing protein [unclassified Pseudonocardia]MBN9100801.1 hypothetical protein [Pseudonocardia sp.]OJY44153.1 MAG: hypothetical protein BGP03_07415 [Pseudonocardia sp. 73-21]
MFTINGIPAHPLVIHAVVVLLPLATLGALLIAVRPRLRRTFGIPVLLMALVGVAAVPVATQTGEQLQRVLPGPNPLIQIHEQRGNTLLPWAVAFLVVLAVAVVTEFRTSRPVDGATTRTSSRVTTIATVLAAVLGLVVTGLVVWIGDAGATAVWKGVGRG